MLALDAGVTAGSAKNERGIGLADVSDLMQVVHVLARLLLSLPLGFFLNERRRRVLTLLCLQHLRLQF